MTEHTFDERIDLELVGAARRAARSETKKAVLQGLLSALSDALERRVGEAALVRETVEGIILDVDEMGDEHLRRLEADREPVEHRRSELWRGYR